MAKDNGDVTGKTTRSAKADKITISYTGEDNTRWFRRERKIRKENGQYPEVQINPNTGEITIPENKVKDGTEVTEVTKMKWCWTQIQQSNCKDVQNHKLLNGIPLTETANSPIPYSLSWRYI